MPVFICQLCSYSASTLQRHLEHRNLHTVRHADKYHCGYEGCKFNFNREVSLRSHLLRCHNLQVSVDRRKTIECIVQDSGGKLKCSVSLCGQMFGKYGDLSKHLASHISSGSEVKCPVSGCARVYRVVSSLRSHISKYHRSVIATENVEQVDEGGSNDVEMGDEAPLMATEDFPDLRSIFFTNLSYLFLEMETNLLIPATSIQKVAAHIFTLQGIHLQHVQEVLGNFLISKTDPNLARAALDLIENSDLFTRCKNSLSTTHKRHAFYKNNLSYIPPTPVMFGENDSKCFHYVSIKDSVKSVIKSTADLNRSSNLDPLILRDIFDGTNIREDPFFRQKNTLALILFADAFEVASRAKKKHKLLGIYFTIGNLPSHLRSHLDFIFLIALCKEKDFNTDRNGVHSKIVNELREIEKDGISLESGEVVYGSVCAVCGDSLGAHGIAEMVENFSKSLHFCRFCLISRPEFVAQGGQMKFYDRRTVESYNQSVAEKRVSGEMFVKGVRGDSIYNTLSHYHVCKPGLPPCLAHDLFEGIVSVDVALYLRYFVEKVHWFSYKTLNNLIKDFPYTTEDQRDKPELVNRKPKKIVGKACQIWTFLRLLPLIIFSKIKDRECEVWKTFLRLQEIVDIICSPVIHESVLPYLELLISDYIFYRVKLFPGCGLRPKHHYLSHYPELIRVFGPLIFLWTLRFESKHGYFIRVLVAGKNFKNVTKSASEKHQLYQAYMLATRKDVGNISMKGEMDFHSGMYEENIRRELATGGVGAGAFFDCSSVMFKGTTYCKGDLLAYEQAKDDDSLKLGTIRVIITDGRETLLFIVQCVNSEYDAGLRAYVLGEHRGFCCLNVIDLIHHQPVRQYKIGVRIYAKLKHAIVCNPRVPVDLVAL